MQIVTDPSERAFRRHYGEIYRYVRGRTHDHHDAEDLAQQVFTDAAAALPDDARPPLAWLYAVAKRRFADEARRRRVRREAPVALAPAAEAYDERVAAALHGALARLPAAQRDVVVLKLLRGVSFAEIGRIVGASEEAARMRFSRALRAIRADLEQEGLKP
jgi:RNA polymerase sigma-70 factor (ECF subfamily)